LDRGCVGDEGDDAHLGAAVWALQGQNLESADQEYGPQVTRLRALEVLHAIASRQRRW